MSELPQGWTECKLGEICYPSQYGWTSSAAEIGENFRFLRTTDISKGNINWSSVPFCEQVPEEPERYLLKPNDIVISRAGSIGLSALIGECPPSLFASYLIRFRPLEQFSAKYLAFYLQSPHYWQQVRASAVGIALQNVNATKLSRIDVPISPRTEQDRIVAEIEKQFTRLDDAVAALKRVHANLKRYRASVLKAACEGRLVPTEAELARKEGRGYEPAGELLKRIRAERRAKWEVDQLKKMIAAGKPPKNDEWKNAFEEPLPPQASDTVDLPAGWYWTTCGVIADAIDPHPSHRTPAEHAGGVPYIGMGDVSPEGGLDRNGALKVAPSILEEHRERYILRDGDFFVGKIGTLGKPVHVCRPYDYALSANIVLIQPFNLIDGRFLFYWMGSPSLEKILIRDSRATTQAAFGIKRFRTLPCPLPPFVEQQRIADEVDRRLSATAAIQKDLQLLTTRSTRLRQSILNSAFSGTLVPQDPNDEPASVLLERIRAERAALATNNGNQKAIPEAGTANRQRRRRVARLAHRVSGGKGAEK